VSPHPSGKGKDVHAGEKQQPSSFSVQLTLLQALLLLAIPHHLIHTLW